MKRITIPALLLSLVCLLATESATAQQPGANGAATTQTGQWNTNFPQPLLLLTFDGAETAVQNHGAKLVAGKVGKGIQTDGNTYADVPWRLPTGASPRTLAVWLKAANTKGGTALVYGPNGKHMPFGIMNAGGKWRFYDNGGGLGTERAVDTDWHHHCIVYDGNELTYYIDGESVSATAKTLTTTPNKAPLVLGMGPDHGKWGDSWPGIIDEVVIYAQAIHPNQVKGLLRLAELNRHPPVK